MFRNDTFSDESRRGVLALEGQSPISLNTHKEDFWHTDIKKAVHKSIVVAFGTAKLETDAVAELQSALRGLVVDGAASPADVASRAKVFFTQLSDAL